MKRNICLTLVVILLCGVMASCGTMGNWGNDVPGNGDAFDANNRADRDVNPDNRSGNKTGGKVPPLDETAGGGIPGDAEQDSGILRGNNGIMGSGGAPAKGATGRADVLASKVKIGLEEVKAIAAEHAELNVAELRFLKLSLLREEGKQLYDLLFVHDDIVFAYKIDAASGDILEFSHRLRLPSPEQRDRETM